MSERTTRPRRRVEPAPSALNLTIDEAATVIGVGRTAVFDMIRAGALRSFKIGRDRRVTREEAVRKARELAAVPEPPPRPWTGRKRGRKPKAAPTTLALDQGTPAAPPRPALTTTGRPRGRPRNAARAAAPA